MVEIFLIVLVLIYKKTNYLLNETQVVVKSYRQRTQKKDCNFAPP